MIIIEKTIKIQGQVNVEELKNFLINEQEFYNTCYIEFKLGNLDFQVRVSDFNPLTDCDYSPTFLSFLKNYTVGTKELSDKNGNIVNVVEQCNNSKEVETWLKKNGYFFHKVLGYEHGGLSLALDGFLTPQFTCPFDSGEAGFLVMQKSLLREARAVKRLNAKILNDELYSYKTLIEELNHYLNGTKLNLIIEGNETYESFDAYSIEELCKLMLPFINAA